MGLCACCAALLEGASELCAHHHFADGVVWAENNKVLGDLLHRGKVPPRLSAELRADDRPTPEGC